MMISINMVSITIFYLYVVFLFNFYILLILLSMFFGSIINMGEIKYKKVYQKYSAK